MKIDIRTIGDARILDCSGKITLGEGTMSIRNTVRDILQSGVKKIVINLADINYIDSAGVGRTGEHIHFSGQRRRTVKAPEADEEDPKRSPHQA
jgi:anti-anti-sigma factor